MSYYRAFENTNHVMTIIGLEELMKGRTIEFSLPNDLLRFGIDSENDVAIQYNEAESAIHIYRNGKDKDTMYDVLSVDEFLARIFDSDNLPRYVNRSLVEESAVSVEE